MRMIARNVDSGTVVADHVVMATTRRERAVGLLTRSRLDAGEGLLILPCRGVHTWGMRFAIDIVALDESGRVVDAVAALRPWRIRLPRRGAVSVLELPAGSLAQSLTRRGDRIVLEQVPAEARS
jgi:uncharacterized membrane protein (UPF0127 family)